MRNVQVESHYRTNPNSVAADAGAEPLLDAVVPISAPEGRLGWPLAAVLIVGVSALLWVGIAVLVGWLFG